MNCSRSAFRVLAPRRTTLRSLHTTAARFASPFPSPFPSGQPGPAPDELPEAARHAFQKVAQHEGAKNALKEIAALMQKKGIDMTQKPSTMQLLKLGMDPELKNAALNVMKELKSAGVDITPQNAMELFSGLNAGKKP